MTPKRVIEIEEMTKNVSAGKIFVTAVLDFSAYNLFSNQPAWETEVRIAAVEEHTVYDT